jgi:hypothetical protein
MNLSNVIPGTTNNPLCPEGPYVTSPGVKSGFEEYTADIANRKALSVIEAVEAEARANLPVQPPKESKVNDKKEAALRVFNENKSTMSNGKIAKLIARELEITYANAYYYVTRVFKR